MIYSKWKPSKGGYDYFEGKDKDIPLGNDLPIPSLPRGTDIGVASTEVGRPMPAGAKFVGSGQDAVGLIAPSERSSLHGLTDAIPTTYMYMAAGVLIGWLVFTKRVKIPS